MKNKRVMEILLDRCSASFKGDHINLFSIDETKEVADFIDQQEKHIEELKEILQDVLSDCYLADGMRLEIERLTSE